MTEAIGHAREGLTFSNDAEAIRAISALLTDESTRRVLLCGHVRPDGDCIGSMVALYDWLTRLGKETRLFFRNLQMENLLEMLPKGAAPGPVFPSEFEADATVCVDVAEPERITDGFLGLARGVVVNIDHHISNSNYGDLNWVKPHAAATGELVVDLIDANDGWTPEIANALFIALATDTGSFRYGNTTASALRAAARLVERGACPAACAALVWGNRHPNEVRLTAWVLNALRFELGGRFVWAEITQKTYREHGGEANDPESLSGEMRSIRGVEVAALIRETPEGEARASLRSSGKIDVSRIAARLGGGGHRAAAGVHAHGNFADGREAILETLRKGIEEQIEEIGED
jgi:phosphoesterase RecJ-like protein